MGLVYNPRRLDIQASNKNGWEKRRNHCIFKGMEDDEKNKDAGQARRLRLLREVKGYKTASHFAREMGIEYKRWNNFENGYPLSKEAAFILVKRIPGLTLDWLFFGRLDGLSFQLARELDEGYSNNEQRAS